VARPTTRKTRGNIFKLVWILRYIEKHRGICKTDIPEMNIKLSTFVSFRD
jgi:hypothetical protein